MGFELPAKDSVFHTFEIDPTSGEPLFLKLFAGTNGSKKYIHPVLGYEVVVTANNKIETNSINIGTYNFYNPESVNTTPLISDNYGHIAFDVLPYYAYGNDNEDPSQLIERLIRSVNRYIGK
ncbi:MAG: hypothetical protein JEY71_10380 [Sphaerochaeta sp.]|nr:hypothetical protein [Sphaerochaeta sp.]